MVTADDIGAIAIFAALGATERERLSRAAADITLAPGEYAAHEGSERALFAVLEGRIEPVKVVDGIERVVGERRPGDIFGEVPIVLGTVFPVGFRAAETVARHAGRGSRLPRRRGRGARRRQGGRQARGPPDGRFARAAGHRGRPASAARDRRRASLGRVLRGAAALPRAQPDHVQVADARRDRTPPSTGAAPCPPTGTGRRSASSTGRPWCDRSCAGWPSCSASGPSAMAAEYDAVIVGAGPAGLAAAVYGASEGLRTIVIEREAPGGQAGTSSRIENYLGLPGGRVRGRAGEPCAPAGAEARCRDPRHPVDHADRPRDAARAPRRRRRPAGEDDHPGLRRHVAAPVDRRVRPARREGNLLRGGAQRGGGDPWPGRPHRGRRQLGGAGGHVLLQPRDGA